MRPLPPLNALMTFEVAARHLSFTKAAVELNMTQGAVSKQIIALENQLGAKLFLRRTRNLDLTSAGLALLPQIRDAIELIERATTELAPDNSACRLEIAIPPTLAMRWLMPRLQSFRQAYPDIELKFQTAFGGTISEFIAQKHKIDIAVLRLRPDERENLAFSDYLMDDDHVVVCKRKFVDAGLKTPEDLSNHTMLHSSTRKHAWKEWLSAVGNTTVDPAQGLHFDHHHFALQAAANGIGIAIAPYPLIEEYVRENRMVFPFDVAAASGTAYFLVYDGRRIRDPHIRALRDWMIDAGKTMRVPNPSMHTSDGRPMRRLSRFS